jgi:hypothetical protein
MKLAGNASTSCVSLLLKKSASGWPLSVTYGRAAPKFSPFTVSV